MINDISPISMNRLKPVLVNYINMRRSFNSKKNLFVILVCDESDRIKILLENLLMSHRHSNFVIFFEESVEILPLLKHHKSDFEHEIQIIPTNSIYIFEFLVQARLIYFCNQCLDNSKFNLFISDIAVENVKF
jgi:hypothetical protein